METTHAFLLVSKDKKSIENWILDLIQKTKTSWTDILKIEAENNKIPIKKIRELINWVNLAPYESESKIALIPEAEAMNLEASNALLKTLEEPPDKTMIVLGANDADAVLATIRSRCRLIKIKEGKIIDKEESIKLNNDIIQDFELAEKLAKDENLIGKLDQLILEYRQDLINGDKNKKDDLKKILTAKRLLLTTNVNARLLLENLFLAITST